MTHSVRRAFANVTQALVAVTDHVSGADIVRKDQQTQEQTQLRMAARIKALRAGFTNIRERHDELSNRLSVSRQQRA